MALIKVDFIMGHCGWISELPGKFRWKSKISNLNNLSNYLGAEAKSQLDRQEAAKHDLQLRRSIFCLTGVEKQPYPWP
jgi:hypothetical protein